MFHFDSLTPKTHALLSLNFEDEALVSYNLTEEKLKEVLQTVRDQWLQNDEADWIKSHDFYNDGVTALRHLSQQTNEEFSVCRPCFII